MKKRSEQKDSERKPHSPPIFFIDRSLGKKVVAQELSNKGVLIERHDDHFPQDAIDEDWVAKCGEMNWVVLTRDKKIRYRPAELDALRSANVSAVFLTGKGARGIDFARAFLKALPTLENLLSARDQPMFIRVTREGTVREIEPPRPKDKSA